MKIRLQTVLLLANLAIFLLPFGGIHFLRLYENELIRQTESELIAQAAFLGAIYKEQLREIVGEHVLQNLYGIKIEGSLFGTEDKPGFPEN
ncbi:MAG: hypothetical protein QNJ31_09285 [Candidatus Caenarcaniphilales bacterium]|nr:hypothetical protein [Candidatus Caenarcaniphilales bacterium]